MANTAVTSVQAKINSQVEYVVKAATADEANEKEIFDITPAKRDGKFLIIINNAATDQGSITYSIAAGDFWAGKAITGTIAQGKAYVIEVETAKVKQGDGNINIELAPATGKILLTNHAATVACVQLS
jgi:hypothetical protein